MGELTPAQQMLITLAGLGFIASTFSSAIVMWKVFRGIERFLEIPNHLDAILYELKPNGGHSLRDEFKEEAVNTRTALDRLSNTIAILQRTFKHEADREEEFRRKILEQTRA